MGTQRCEDTKLIGHSIRGQTIPRTWWRNHIRKRLCCNSRSTYIPAPSGASISCPYCSASFRVISAVVVCRIFPPPTPRCRTMELDYNFLLCRASSSSTLVISMLSPLLRARVVVAHLGDKPPTDGRIFEHVGPIPPLPVTHFIKSKRPW